MIATMCLQIVLIGPDLTQHIPDPKRIEQKQGKSLWKNRVKSSQIRDITKKIQSTYFTGYPGTADSTNNKKQKQ